VYFYGRQCALPQSEDDMGLCYYDAQRHIDILKKHAAGKQISGCLDAGINTACDLSAACTLLFCATAQGYIKPKTATTLAYLGNLMLQTHHFAKAEYQSAFKDAWPALVKESIAFKPNDSDDPDKPATPTPNPPSAPPADQPHEDAANTDSDAKIM
jgi:hypothetical protein